MRYVFQYAVYAVFAVCILNACGGAGNDAGVNPAQSLPPPPPPPPDPTSTTEWVTLVVSLGARFDSEKTQLETDQDAAQGQAVAAGQYFGGNYLAGARDRFTNHVLSFFDFAFDETILWSNRSSVTFERADVIALLDDHRGQWLQYLDDFLASSFFSGHSSANLNLIRPDMLSSINSAYDNTISRLDQWGALASTRPNDSALQGSWATVANDLTIAIHSSGQILGFDHRGCRYVGILVAPTWLQPASKVIMKQECGPISTLLSGTILLIIHNDQSTLVFNVSSVSTTIDTILIR